MKQKIFKELASINFQVVAFAMRAFSRLNDLVDHLASAYDKDDIASGKMTNELINAYRESQR